MLSSLPVLPSRVLRTPRHITVPFGAEAPSGHVAQAWTIPSPSWGLLSQWHRQQMTTSKSLLRLNRETFLRDFTLYMTTNYAIISIRCLNIIMPVLPIAELSTGRMNPRASGRVGSGHDFAGFWQVGSGQHFGNFSFLLNISGFLNKCESLNTAFGLMGFLRYLIYIIIKQLINYYSIKLNIHIRF